MTTEPDYRTEPDFGIDIIEHGGGWAVREIEDQYHCVDARGWVRAGRVEIIHRMFEAEEEAKQWAHQLKLRRVTDHLEAAEVIIDEAFGNTDEGEPVRISEHYFYQIRGAITDAIRLLEKLCEIKNCFLDDLQEPK